MPASCAYRSEPASPQIVTTPSPDVLDGLGLTQRDEPVVTGGGVLAAKEAESGHARHVRHRFVGRIERKPAKVRQTDKGREPRRSDAELGRVEVQGEEACELSSSCIPRSVNGPRSRR